MRWPGWCKVHATRAPATAELQLPHCFPMPKPAYRRRGALAVFRQCVGQTRHCNVFRGGARTSPAANSRRRVRGALTARGTRREPVHGCSMAASMPPSVPQSARTPHQTVDWWSTEESGPRPWSADRLWNVAHRPTQLVLARPPSPDLTRHGCRVSAYKDVLAACPAMVGGQGPCSHATDPRLALPHRPRNVSKPSPKATLIKFQRCEDKCFAAMVVQADEAADLGNVS